MVGRRPSKGQVWVALVVALAVHLQIIIGGWVYGLLHPPEDTTELEYIAVSEDELAPGSLPPEAPIELPLEQPLAEKAKPLGPTPPPKSPSVPVPPPPAIVQAPTNPTPAPPPPEKVTPEQPKPQRLKAVEQQYEKDEEENKNARFLGEKNKHVRPEEETRAEVTNLERESKGEASETPNDSKDKRKGDGEHKIGRLTVAPGASPKRRAPMGKMPAQGAGAKGQSDRRERSEGGVEPSELGDLPSPTGPSNEGALNPKLGARLRRGLGSSELEALYGHAEASQQPNLMPDEGVDAPPAGEDARAKRPGHGYLKRWAKVQSALENFVPEVKPGNQTALGTRAAPFAVYIATMHRAIHELWGFGVLSDWDGKGPGFEANQMELFTTVEIVLKSDGSVDKLTIARPSGVLIFDVAAIDVVMRASPYPPPPQAIRSGNGKTYIHWDFHRDERACGTFGASPFILDQPPDRKPGQKAKERGELKGDEAGMEKKS